MSLIIFCIPMVKLSIACMLFQEHQIMKNNVTFTLIYYPMCDSSLNLTSLDIKLDFLLSLYSLFNLNIVILIMDSTEY